MIKSETRHLIVDGYNIIGAWKDLKELANNDLESARAKLAAELVDYCGYAGYTLLLVFDAQYSDGGEKKVRISSKGDDYIVFTRHDQTADQYIEFFVRRTYGEMVVVSDDALIQIMVFAFASRKSGRELADDMSRAKAEMREIEKKQKHRLDDGLRKHLGADVYQKLEDIRTGKVVYEQPPKVPLKKNSVKSPCAQAKRAEPEKKQFENNRVAKNSKDSLASSSKTCAAEKKNKNSDNEKRQKAKRKKYYSNSNKREGEKKLEQRPDDKPRKGSDIDKRISKRR